MTPSVVEMRAADPHATIRGFGVEESGNQAPIPSSGVPAPTERSDNWPHTTRVLPWMVAAFIAMLWLIPFNTISMRVSLPFDIHFDRIVLPVIFFFWVLSLAAGGRAAPRLKFTTIHGAIGLFLAVAMLSVVLNAEALNRALQYNTAIKQLTVLFSYITMFVVIASVVRRAEVPAFMKYTLGLAVLCSLGALWEYHFHYNVFYDVSSRLLSSPFTVLPANTNSVDEIGRRLIIGPAELQLELAGMLTMAMPVALVGVMQARRHRTRILCGVASCLLLSADVSTYRKTALIAPVVVFLALACFRRRELLKVVPYLLVLVVAVHILAPGAFGGVIEQLGSSRLASAHTVLHRTDAYEAIRPLVWSHPLLGMGYGGYDASRNRILDSQILGSTIEVGVVGLVAYLTMIVSTVVTAVPVIKRREHAASPYALAAAVGAIAFLTLSFLYDVMAFPHVPYIFLTFAAFVAVLARPHQEGGKNRVALR